MTAADRFGRLTELFERARQLPRDQRRALLDASCGDDAGLRQEVERLLAHHDAETEDDRMMQTGAALRRELGAGGDGGEDLPARVGRFRILGEIARGGFGIVLRGEDPAIGRDVAVKILPPRHAADPAHAERLRGEGRIGGKLQHPGIVPVYQLDEADGQPFLVMKVVEGRTLASLLQERAGPKTDRARLLAIFDKLCQAIAYAHSRGVVHRDLKPQNLMVGAFGELQVMDWGLAESCGDDGAHTVAGTPAYMAPEQARGEGGAEPAADVFGLGAILCEILTGEPPFAAATSDEALRQSRRGDLGGAVARLQSCDADPALVALTHRCLAADPAQRPADAGAVARAVRDHLDSLGERAHAAELDAVAARARARSERRARRLTTALGALALLVLVGGGGTALLLRDAARERARQQEVRLRAAMAEVARLRSGAEATDQLAAWQATLAAARNAAGLLTASTPPALRRPVEDQRDEVAARIESLKFANHLGEIARGRAGAPLFEGRQQVEAFSRAFAAYLGGDATQLPTARAAAVLRRNPYREPIVVALDSWAMLEVRRDPRSARAGALGRLADAIDDDAWRRALRRAVASRDLARLHQLANSDEAIEASPVSARLLSIDLRSLGDGQTSIDVLRRAYVRNPGDFDLVFDLASNYQGIGDLPRARRFATAALSLRPEDPAAYFLMGEVCRVSGRLDDAARYARAGLRLDPERFDLWYTLGYAQTLRGEHDEASASLERSLSLASKDFAVYSSVVSLLGDVRLAQGRPDDAAKRYLQSLAAPRVWPETPEWKAAGPTARHELRMALERCRAAEPDAPGPLYLLGQLDHDEGRLVDALGHYEKLASSHPDFAFVQQRIHALREMLGVSLASYGSIDEALAAAERNEPLPALRARLLTAVERAGGTGLAARKTYVAAAIRARGGDLEAAATGFEQVIQQDPGATEPWLRLHRVLVGARGQGAAEKRVRALLEQHPTEVPLPIAPAPPRLLAPPENAVVDGSRSLVLRCSEPDLVDPRLGPARTRWQVWSSADPASPPVVDVITTGTATTELPVPPALMERGTEYAWQATQIARRRLASSSGIGRFRVDDRGGTPLPIDLGAVLDTDVIADPGDGDEDWFDPTNHFSLVLNGYDGQHTGRDDVQGLPPDRRVGVHRLAPYSGPNALRLRNGQTKPVSFPLPRRRYAGLRLLVSAANGIASIPSRLIYDDGSSTECWLGFADWFQTGRDTKLGCGSFGVPLQSGMDRISPSGIEERNAAKLFEITVPADPSRRAIGLALEPARAVFGATATCAYVFAVTGMVAPGS